MDNAERRQIVEHAAKLIEQNPDQWCRGYWFAAKVNRDVGGTFTHDEVQDLNQRMATGDLRALHWLSDHRDELHYCAEGAMLLAAIDLGIDPEPVLEELNLGRTREAETRLRPLQVYGHNDSVESPGEVVDYLHRFAERFAL